MVLDDNVKSIFSDIFEVTDSPKPKVVVSDVLICLLKSNGLDDEYINNFLNELGVDGDGVYYIKVKDSYMTPTTKLINVDAERTVYLDQFKDLIK